LVSNIDLGIEGDRFTVCAKRPIVSKFETIAELNDAIVERWGDEGDLQALIDAGIKQYFTRPTYKSETVVKLIAEGKIAEAHKEAQSAIDNYAPGRKATGGVTQKAKVQKLNTMEEQAKAMGFASLDDMIRATAELKKQGVI
jgi:hypothetical protein